MVSLVGLTFRHRSRGRAGTEKASTPEQFAVPLTASVECVHPEHRPIDCRDRRSLFPESRRPPPGLDSCVSAHGFCVLPPSSRTTLEVRPIDSGALLRFLGGSRPLLHDSGEKSCVTTIFRHHAGRCFSYIPIFSKRAKRSKKAIQIPKSKFRYLDHFAVGGRGLITSVR